MDGVDAQAVRGLVDLSLSLPLVSVTFKALLTAAVMVLAVVVGGWAGFMLARRRRRVRRAPQHAVVGTSPYATALADRFEAEARELAEVPRDAFGLDLHYGRQDATLPRQDIRSGS